MAKHWRYLQIVLIGAFTLGLGGLGWAQEFEEARIFIEYNETDNDLGFHVFLDGEDWETLKIVRPGGVTIFEIDATGGAPDLGYAGLGLTELFFEGAEPSLDPPGTLEDLLERFPEGEYTIMGVTVDGTPLTSTATLTHAVPAGPDVSAKVAGRNVTISWDEVTESAAILPGVDVEIVGYQVIVGSFQVTLPASSRQVTLPKDFVESLEPGEEQDFEVLAIEEGGNQTITADSFEIKTQKP
jgi:hypothetical protein